MLLQRLLLIGFAGLAGTLCRYGLSGLVARRFGETFPTGTLLVNIIGCFLAGFLFYPLHERLLVSEVIRTALTIGFLGGFTTFSSFGLQTFTLLRDGEYAFALVNVLISNAIGLASVWIGYSLARLVWV
jgi:fluoride exporter